MPAEPQSTEGLDVLPPGTMLGERFRIVRAVGSGGMGMVYEAIDEALDRRIAIKCARAGHRQSLPPEARTAREVSHFNVCKVHEFHTASTEAGDVSFLAMEFVDGETLWARIRRGPLPPGEALGIARQICAGLEQAHRQGVIHGDLKAANVILAKTAEGGTRAVITDFGLARFAAPDGSRVTSARGGTRDYMSPEMLQGAPASISSDIYALGILLHAMLAGRTPEWTRVGAAPAHTPERAEATSDPTVTMAGRIVEEEWQRPVGELPRPWRQVIRRAIEANPARRHRSAGAVWEGLAPRRRAARSAAAAAAVLMALGVWQWRAPEPGPAVRLAVLPFEAEAGIGAGAPAVALEVAERLSGARRNFTVITPAEARQNEAVTPEKARTVLGATHALRTRLTSMPDQLGVEAQLVDIESGNTLRTLKAAYAAGDSATLARALVGTVTAGLNLRSRSPKDTVSDRAHAAYIQGLTLLREDPRKAAAAIPLLEQAVALDARSALPSAELALAQAQRYRNGDGREWLDRAAESAAKATGLNPDSVAALIATGTVEQLRGRYDQSVIALHRGVTLDAGNARAWRMLAETYQLAGRDQDAVETYRKAMTADPRGYLASMNFGTYYWTRGEYRRAEEMYRTTTERAPGLASGHMNLGLALKAQGRYREAEESLRKALSLRPSARLLLNLGALYYEQERYEDALRAFEDSAKAGPPSWQMQCNLGDAYRHLGRTREAADAYRAAQAQTEQELTTNARSADARARLALLCARLGDRKRAAFELSQATATAGSSATATANAVQAFEVLNERQQALDLLERAPRTVVEGLDRVPDLKELRQDPRFRRLIQKQ